MRKRPGHGPGLVWLGGFKSDMGGTKAVALDQWAEAHGRACLRFDYSGHGESGGHFADGTISRWLAESLAVFTTCCEGPQVLVGSSMGGWITLLLARELRRASSAEGHGRRNGAHRARGGFHRGADVEALSRRDQTGDRDQRGLVAAVAIFRRALPHHQRPDRGRPQSSLLGGLIETGCPVRILQGVQDPDVPWNHAVELVSRLAQDDVVLSLIKDGDHRLSRPEDIERLLTAVAEF